MALQLDFSKSPNGLIPAVVQDATTKTVLMLGYMNQEALDVTHSTGKVTFFSRSKQRLWTKGETSGHYLEVVSMLSDCDNDAILIKARPVGPTCHTGADTCWFEPNITGEELNQDWVFIQKLISTIQKRKLEPSDAAYTSQLFKKGINKVAQKVGEEAVELVIEAKDDNKELFMGEAADLFFHYLVLLEAKGYSFFEVLKVLQSRHK